MKVSIIMPFYSAEKYIGEAIASVIEQSHDDWELLLVNDGSKDGSGKIIADFTDPRIRCFEQENKGVSEARNVGLSAMTGDLYMFLDADDKLPKNSLLSRVALFKANRDLTFVDGGVVKMDADLKNVLDEWTPALEDNPFLDLITLGGCSFRGLTWMIRRSQSRKCSFRPGLTHGEDLLYLLDLARTGGQYSYVEEPVLYYRNVSGSAMKNLRGLEKGYREIFRVINKWPECAPEYLKEFDNKTRRIMFRSYLREFRIWQALRVWFAWQ